MFIVIVFSLKFRAIKAIDGKEVIEEIDEFLRIHVIGILHAKAAKTSSNVHR